MGTLWGRADPGPKRTSERGPHGTPPAVAAASECGRPDVRLVDGVVSYLHRDHLDSGRG